MQDHERVCTTVLIRAIERSGMEVGAYVYDGVLVRREGLMSCSSAALPAQQLEDWAAAVEAATGFRIQLAEKPMEANTMFLYQAPSQLAGTYSADGGASSSTINLVAPSALGTALSLATGDAEELRRSLRLPRAVQNWRYEVLDSNLAKLVPSGGDTCLFGEGPGHNCPGHNCCIFVTPYTISVCCGKAVVTNTNGSLLTTVWAALSASDSDEDDSRPSPHLRLVRQVSATQCLSWDSHNRLYLCIFRFRGRCGVALC